MWKEDEVLLIWYSNKRLGRNREKYSKWKGKRKHHYSIEDKKNNEEKERMVLKQHGESLKLA